MHEHNRDDENGVVFVRNQLVQDYYISTIIVGVLVNSLMVSLH